MTDRPWDLLVVGGGTAGIIAARTAAGYGARVLLVERDRIGGDCLWTGCVPSKALLAAANAAAAARRAERLGIHIGGVRVDIAGVMAHVNSAITAIEPGDTADALSAAGIRVRRCTVTFTGPASAEVDGAPVTFGQAVIATGSTPRLPDIDGLSTADPLTSDTVWDLADLPRRLVVLGAGSAGCELGQAFARLGSNVTLIEVAPRPLPREDPAASQVILRALQADRVALQLGASITRVTADSVVLAEGLTVGYDRLLVATGRRPRTDGLRLDRAHVELDPRGYIGVDAQLRTSNPRIWAAGDVTGHPQFTHTAAAHASTAATNAILGARRRADVTAQPRVTFTQPEVAAVGVPTGGTRDRRIRVHAVDHRHVDRAVTDGCTDGLTRLAVDRKGRIVGATIVGPHAGETIAELALAVRMGHRARDLAATTHAYPTYALGPWTAGIAAVQAALGRTVPARVLHAVVAVRRAWIGRRRGARAPGAGGHAR